MIKGLGVVVALGWQDQGCFNDRISVELMKGFPVCRKHWSFVLQLHQGPNWRKLAPTVGRLSVVSVRHKIFIISINIIMRLSNGTSQERS